MGDTQWSRADRAAAALDTWMMAAHPESSGYGDEGSDVFRDAVMGLLVDLKHLLWRADTNLLLTNLAEDAAEAWAVEVEVLPEGSGDDE